MNRIQTACGNCPYNLNNEQCTNPEECYGCFQKPAEDFNNTAFGGSSNHWMSKPIFCSICGKPLSGVYVGPSEDNPQDAFHICNECKAAIEWSKNKMKEEAQAEIKSRQSSDPNGFHITLKEFVQRFIYHGTTIVIKEQWVIPREERIDNKIIGEATVWRGLDSEITDDEGTCPFKDAHVFGIFIPKENEYFKRTDVGIAIEVEYNKQPTMQSEKSNIHEELGILGK